MGDTDDDNFLAASDTVTITALFNEAMTSTPTISISGTSISNQVMTKIITSIGTPTLFGDIDGEAQGDESSAGEDGDGISFSANGLRVAIAAKMNNGIVVDPGGNGADRQKGHVRIYDYNGSAWEQVGGDIDGERGTPPNNSNIRGDLSGWSVSLSADGTRVAIGAPNNDSNNNSYSHDSGHVRVFQYQVISGTVTWTQIGDDIDGEEYGDRSGSSVSLSADGTILAVGAEANDGANGSDSGHVRVFQYQVISGTATWTQLGQDIDGEAAGDGSGGLSLYLLMGLGLLLERLQMMMVEPILVMFVFMNTVIIHGQN